MRTRALDRERGAMAVTIGLICVVLAVLAMGSATVGRMVAVKKDAQRAADAAVLAASQIVKSEGLPFNAQKMTAAENIARGNTRLPARFTWAKTETATDLQFTVTADIDVEVSKMIYPNGQVTVSAKAGGQVPQTVIDQVTKRLPKIVLVLDYSGSMDQTLPGSGGQRAIDVLEASISALVGDATIQVIYGAAFFSDNTFATVPFAQNAPNQIKTVMANNDIHNMTCTACGLVSAKNLLAANEDTGRYVILVSDGLPSKKNPGCSGSFNSCAVTAARSIWGISGEIFTLHIDWSGGQDPTLKAFMVSVSGTQAQPGKIADYFPASDANTLHDNFKAILSAIVCSSDPLNPRPEDLSSLQVFLRRPAGDERKITMVNGDIAAPAYDNVEVWRYDSPTNTIRINQKACNAVLDNGDKIVVRYDSPELTL